MQLAATRSATLSIHAGPSARGSQFQFGGKTLLLLSEALVVMVALWAAGVTGDRAKQRIVVTNETEF